MAWIQPEIFGCEQDEMYVFSKAIVQENTVRSKLISFLGKKVLQWNEPVEVS